VADTELQELASQMVCVLHPPGHSLFRQGQQPDGFQILESGKVALWTRIGDERKDLIVFTGGEPLCASGIIQGTARLTSADTVTEARIWQLHRSAINAMRTQMHPLSFRLMEWSIRHTARSFTFAFPSVLERIGAVPLDSELHPQPLDGRALTATDEPQLRVIPFLRDVSRERMASVLREFSAVTLPRGAALCARGGDPGPFFLVVRGALEASARTDQGKVRHGIRGPGRVAGHEAFFGRSQQPLDVTTKETSLLLRLDRQGFDALFAARDPLALDIIEWASWSITSQFDTEMRELVRRASERAQWDTLYER
jgi:CRP-like cAMP-binding protein